MNHENIFHKWDAATAADEFDAARISCAKIALDLLARVIALPEKTQRHLVMAIGILCRKAMLTCDEKKSLFGDMLPDGLQELILDEGNAEATLLAALEMLDGEAILHASVLLNDMNKDDLQALSSLWERHWASRHDPDAALVALLAHRRCGIMIDGEELTAMKKAVEKQWPRVDSLFGLIK